MLKPIEKIKSGILLTEGELKNIIEPPHAVTTLKEIVRREVDILRDKRGRILKGERLNPVGIGGSEPSLSFALKKRLKDHPEEQDAIIDAVIKLAKMGDIRATELLWERLDGKVVEKHLFESDAPVVLTFIPAERLLQLQKGEEGGRNRLMEGVFMEQEEVLES